MADRYVNIPITLLRTLHIDSKSFFNDAFDVGIYLYSKTLEGNELKRYKDALKYLGITQISPAAGIRNAKDVLSNIPNNYPTTGIETDILFNYYKSAKSEFEIICLAAFLAIKSIIGKKHFDKTNKAMIHARMFGYNTPKEMPQDLSEAQKKYKIRYHMDKLLEELQLNWHLKVTWNHNRGFYVSFDLTLEQLAALMIKGNRQTKLKQLKEEKARAIEKALATAS